MRLRLLERLGRLVGWRFGSQGDRNGRSRDSRTAGAEASGRHRRNAGAVGARDRATAGIEARSQAPPPLQPPAGLPRRDDAQSPRLAPRTAGVRAGGAAMPPLPRNYTPGQGGGIGRARIREAPFGAAPLDTAARPVPGADQARGAAAPDGRPRRRGSRGTRSSAARPRPGGWPGQAGRAGAAAARGGVAAQKAPAKAAATPASGARALLPFAAPAPGQPPGDGRRAAELRAA